MTFRRSMTMAAILATLTLPGAARAQGLLDQMFRSTPVDETPTSTATAKPEPAKRKPVDASKPKPKPHAKPLAWKAPTNPPLPLPRPWGMADADGSDETATASVKSEEPALLDAAREPLANKDEGIRASGLQPAIPAPRPEAMPSVANERPAERSMVIIVRDGVRGPEDLSGRRIATGLSTESPDDLRRMVEQSAGVSVSPVAVGWSAGLTSLARGEIDGVLLSLGPRIAARETEGVTLAGYQLLEIPLAASP